MNILKAVTTDALGSIRHSFNFVWSTVSPILLPLILILAFISIGLWVANLVSDKLGDFVKKGKIDTILDRIVSPVTKITGTKVNLSSIIASSIRWFFIAIVLIAALDLADLHGVTDFLKQALAYLPNIFVSALILIVGSLVASLAGAIVATVSKGNFAATAKVAVNALALIAALSQLVTPLVGALSQFIGHLALSKLQGDVFFIGILVLVLLASKSTVTKTVENLYKT